MIADSENGTFGATSAAADQTLTISAALHHAIEHHKAGRLPEAERLYRAILQADPRQPDAHHNLGQLARQVGQPRAALPHLKAALEAKPEVAQYWLSLIAALIECNEVQAARSLLDQARSRGLNGAALEALDARLNAVAPALPQSSAPPAAEPNAPAVHAAKVSAVGTARAPHPARKTAARLPQRTGKKGAALERLAQEATDAFNRGEDAVALDKALRVLAKAPRHFTALIVYGGVHYRRGAWQEAETALQQALAIDPNHRTVLALQAALLDSLGRYDASAATYRRALALYPNDVELHRNFSYLLCKMGHYGEAETEARAALAIDANDFAAHCNLATALSRLDRLEEAILHTRRAIEINPGHPALYRNLSELLKRLDRCSEALTVLDQGLQATDQEALINRFHYWLTLPWIMQSRQEIAHWRTRFAEGIAALGRIKGTIEPHSICSEWFRLPYHGEDDRPLMSALCALMRAKAPKLNYVAPHLAAWQFPQNRRIRVGFLSHGWHYHPVGRFFTSWIERLDRQRFEVIVIHAPNHKHDALREAIDARCDRAYMLTGVLERQQAQLADLALDVLFLPNAPEIIETYLLAYGRYAPVQVASWGIAATTGIDSIDYYLSSHLIEPEDAPNHYSERLVLLDSLPGAMNKIAAMPERMPDRAFFSLPSEGRIYLCSQSLFKLHPDFDAVLAEIAARDPEGHIVMIEGLYAPWTERLKARWQTTAPQLAERVIWLPQQPGGLFGCLQRLADVVLDPVHFGSGTTFFEGMLHGVPFVTWPGRFMRGRIVAGGYRQMGLTDVPVAASIEAYAEVAVNWAHDQARRDAFRQQALAVANDRLFAATQSLEQFETFLLAALQAAARGEKLPSGWRVPQEAASTGRTLGDAR